MATSSHCVKVLYDKEEELVHVLSEKNPKETASSLFKKRVISDFMRDQFASLDHSRLEPQLQIRYLLRCVCKRLVEDNKVWGKFLNLLSSMGASFNTVRNGLQELLDKTLHTVAFQPETTIANKSSDILTAADLNDLTKLLANQAHKWEEIATALDLPEVAIEKCRSLRSDALRLKNVIKYWLSGSTRSATTLYTLREALCSPLVAICNVGMSVEEQMQAVKRARVSLPTGTTKNDGSSSNPDIIYQSDYTEVADSKSTLLLCLVSPRESVSHQWKKNGQSLSNSSTYSGVSDDILVISHARQGTEGEYTCHVSSDGKELCSSNKIMLTVEYPPIKKRLLDLYSTNSEVPSDSWPPSGTTTFINLVLNKSTTELTNVTDYSVRGNPDETTTNKEKVKYEDVFGKCKCGDLILLEGRPGSGKSTLVHKVIKDWTQGCALVNAKWVMLITLRDLNNSKAESLTDILQMFCHNDKIVDMSIEGESGEGLCLVLDGFDEYKHQDNETTPIHKLLNKTLLPKATIIVSSRPVAVKNLKQKRLTKKIEVFGFYKENINDYIDSFPFDENTSSADMHDKRSSHPAKLKQYLLEHPNVFHMCYLPVNAAIICFLFKLNKGYIPTTQTKIYQEFTRSIVLRHLTRYKPRTTLTSLHDLSGEDKTNFHNLCQLAFKMTTSDTQTITPKDISVEQPDRKFFGLVTVSLAAKLSGFHTTYSFLHLTFQEFFAAMYVASLEITNQVRIIKESQHKHQFAPMWTFYGGLVNFSEGMERLEKLNWGLMNVGFAFECQEPAVVDYVCRCSQGMLEVSDLTLHHVCALDYFLNNVSLPITYIRVSTSHSDEDFLMLLKTLQWHKHKLYQLNRLGIVKPSLNGAHVNVLADTLNACTEITYGSLPLKDIDYNSMNCLFQNLISLSSWPAIQLDCANSEAGDITALLTSYNQNEHTKLELHLHFKHLDNKAVAELGRQFQQVCDARITILKISHSIFKGDGASSLAIGLSSLTKLTILTLSNNNLDDDEIVELSDGIKHLHSIDTLDLSHNNIASPSSVSSLANAISCLQHLAYLYLSHNRIGPVGATSLASELHHLENLYISGNKINADGAIAVITALENCQQFNRLNINKDERNDNYDSSTIYARDIVSPDDADTIAALVAAAHATPCQCLDLGFTKIDI